ncbi:MAG: aminotransferase class I/II-fold pyridoxal phosphate-dependent enzyme [Planctomycetes bacterium]|nr:aminotransferase class I/II-fold pyridoxal phosphate-dependent enzyme [Planctomycetota bacterium]
MQGIPPSKANVPSGLTPIDTGSSNCGPERASNRTLSSSGCNSESRNGITTPEIVDYLHRVRNPFNTNALAQKAALAALRDDEHVATSRVLNESEMAVVESELRDLGFHPIPSQANFLYFDTGRDGHDIFNHLLKEGVIVRHIRGSMIRVTIGQPEENTRFLRALKKVIEQ